MNYFWKSFGFFIAMILFMEFAWAQPVYIDHRDQDKGVVIVCVSPSGVLRELPGIQNRSLGTILFGEEVVHQGQEALVKGENHNYILVQTQSGQIGWVDDRYLVKDAGVVVLTEDSRVFERPGNYAAAVGQFFYAGEIAILSDYKDNWVKLIGRAKNKVGWIQGYENLSVEPLDLEIAKLFADAMDIADPDQRILALQNIGDTPNFNSSPLAGVVKEAVLLASSTTGPDLSPGKQFLQEGVNDFLPNGEDDLAEDLFSDLDDLIGDDINNRPGYEIQEVIDMQTGQTVKRVKESGTIQPVKAKSPSTPYYAYHKSLPIGTTVLLEIPGTNNQYLPLTIIARLRNDNPNVIGLGGEVIQKVFGESQAKNVSGATIYYTLQ